MHAGRRNARRGFCSVTHHIAIPIQAHNQWIYSDIWSQLATTLEFSFKIGDRQSEKKQLNWDGRATCNATCGINSRRGLSRHQDVSDGFVGLYPLWQSDSVRMEIFCADGDVIKQVLIRANLVVVRFAITGSVPFEWILQRLMLWIMTIFQG